jgi:hypothetical protein
MPTTPGSRSTEKRRGGVRARLELTNFERTVLDLPELAITASAMARRPIASAPTADTAIANGAMADSPDNCGLPRTGGSPASTA